jgi:predicted permease
MNEIFIPTLNQILYLVTLILIGYILIKTKILPENSSKVLSRIETYILVPSLILSTFISNFTIEKLKTSWMFFAGGTIVILISIILGIFLAKLFTKDEYIKKIYTYGLAFSNFGFMGLAVVKALFPNIFLEYLMFVIPFYIAIYAWAIPSLLIPIKNQEKTFKSKLKRFINPMFISMFIGIILGLINIKLPSFLDTSITTLGNTMSPLAMLLTGVTVAKLSIKETFNNLKVYILSITRLIILPLLGILILKFIDINETLKICTICAISMPLGLNTIVVPAAYDLDTKEASSMSLISHLLSAITIPLIFLLFQYIVL